MLSFISYEKEGAKAVNGIRLKVRKDVASIEVWVRVQQAEKEVFESIRKWLLGAAGLRDDTHVEFMSFY